MWVTALPTVDKRWDALPAWLVTYNEHWLVDRHGFSAGAQSVPAMGSGIIVAWTCQGLAVYFFNMKLRHHITVVMAYCVVLFLHVPTISATDLVREEPIPIQTIITNPQTFNMRAVRLQGIIKTLQVFPGGDTCRVHGQYAGYAFILTDPTGELSIFDLVTCHGPGKPRFRAGKPRMTDFAVGDSVEVVVYVSVSYSPDFALHTVQGALRWVGRMPPLSEASSGTTP